MDFGHGWEETFADFFQSEKVGSVFRDDFKRFEQGFWLGVHSRIVTGSFEAGGCGSDRFERL